MLVYVDVDNDSCDQMKETGVINTEYIVQSRAFEAEEPDIGGFG